MIDGIGSGMALSTIILLDPMRYKYNKHTTALATPIYQALLALETLTPGKELTQVIEFDFLPPTLNDLLRAGKGENGRWLLAECKRVAQAKAITCIKQQEIKPYSGRVWLECCWFTSFRHDHDNLVPALKAILDALEELSIILNDNLEVIQSPPLHWHEKLKKGESDRVTLVLSNTPRHNFERYKIYMDALGDALDSF